MGVEFIKELLNIHMMFFDILHIFHFGANSITSWDALCYFIPNGSRLSRLSMQIARPNALTMSVESCRRLTAAVLFAPQVPKLCNASRQQEERA